MCYNRPHNVSALWAHMSHLQSGGVLDGDPLHRRAQDREAATELPIPEPVRVHKACRILELGVELWWPRGEHDERRKPHESTVVRMQQRAQMRAACRDAAHLVEGRRIGRKPPERQLRRVPGCARAQPRLDAHLRSREVEIVLRSSSW